MNTKGVRLVHDEGKWSTEILAALARVEEGVRLDRLGSTTPSSFEFQPTLVKPILTTAVTVQGVYKEGLRDVTNNIPLFSNRTWGTDVTIEVLGAVKRGSQVRTPPGTMTSPTRSSFAKLPGFVGPIRCCTAI